MTRTLNLAGYKFVELDDAQALRGRIDAQARRGDLKGTLLLAPEGVNFMLAGNAGQLQEFMAWLRADARLADLKARPSWSEGIAFARLKVKVKREIIRMNCPTVRPGSGRAPAIGAATLARWLAAGRDDNGREVVTLDTRNAFEVDRGAFIGTLDWRLASFADFPAALDAHRAELAGRTVVTYCTGGIRCEKATWLMRAAGIEHVFQLDGGVLAYFEQTESAPHWQGDCFVFDEREALDPRLAPHRRPAPAGAPPTTAARAGGSS